MFNYKTAACTFEDLNNTKPFTLTVNSTNDDEIHFLLRINDRAKRLLGFYYYYEDIYCTFDVQQLQVTESKAKDLAKRIEQYCLRGFDNVGAFSIQLLYHFFTEYVRSRESWFLTCRTTSVRYYHETDDIYYRL